MLDHTQGKKRLKTRCQSRSLASELERPRRRAQHHVREEHAAHPHHDGKNMDRDEECHVSRLPRDLAVQLSGLA